MELRVDPVDTNLGDRLAEWRASPSLFVMGLAAHETG